MPTQNYTFQIEAEVLFTEEIIVPCSIDGSTNVTFLYTGIAASAINITNNGTANIVGKHL